jgi:hypothetical protein
MATYTVTDETKEELMNIPSEILPKDALTQIKTFPIRSIMEGIQDGLEPTEIGNMVYDEMSKLEMDNFTDIGMRKSYDWAKFVQAAVQKKLESMVTV